jgi:hypothetical protein
MKKLKLFSVLRNNQKGFGHVEFLIAIVFIGVIGFVGVRVIRSSHAATNNQTASNSSCTVSSTLVNSCRPWLGAAVKGYPQVASDGKSQFLYAESRVGRNLDIFHDYHPAGNLPLNSDELYFASQSNQYDYVNWKPAGNWKDAGGGNAAVNANIDKAAANIKAISPRKIFLTVWHEPQNDVTPGTSNCPGLKGGAGSPAQYVAMWQNVESRFKADGVTNVVWVMNYSGYKAWDCLVPSMWPGNNLVDWVTYDTYSANDSATWGNTVGRFYNVLASDNSNTLNFESKPWGVGEFGDCKTSDQAHIYQYYGEAKAALDANTYSRLKMYMVYDSNGNGAGMGCMTDYSLKGTLDPTEQTDFNAYANDPRFTDAYYQKSTPPPTTAGPTISITAPANGATLSGIVVISDKVSAAAGVKQVTVSWDGTHVIRMATVQNAYGWGTRWGTQKVPNGKHTLTATVVDKNGKTQSSSVTVTTHN